MKTHKIALCLVLFACSKPEASTQPATRTEPAQEKAQSDELGNYETGPWWSRDMRGLFVHAAHILVTHESSQPSGFLSRVQPARRSKAEAETLVRRLSRELAQDPSRFAELARRFSDDRASAELDGVLGTFRPITVMQPIADALGYVKPGELSRIVETEVGFHILRRLPVPEDGALSLSHIVIKHDAAEGWRRSDRDVPSRSKEDARMLAERVHAELKGAPERFPELARAYSEDEDVLRGGDMGVFSRHEDLSPDFTMFERAFRLEMGETTEVIDTAIGFQILQRTEASGREQLAASIITLPYRGSQLERFVPARRSRELAHKLAGKLIAELSKHHQRFGERRVEYCDVVHCDGPFAWKRGRELAILEHEITKLAIGEVGLQPLDTPLGMLVIRREDPATITAQQPAPIFDYAALPALTLPSAPPQPPDPVEELRALGHYALEQMKLKPHDRAQLADLFGQLEARVRNELQQQGDPSPHLHWAEERMIGLLGEEGFEDFERCRRRWLASRTL